MKEHQVFELSKKQEMKEILQTYADGQVEMFQQAMDDWDRVSLPFCGAERTLTPSDHTSSPAHKGRRMRLGSFPGRSCTGHDMMNA